MPNEFAVRAGYIEARIARVREVAQCMGLRVRLRDLKMPVDPSTHCSDCCVPLRVHEGCFPDGDRGPTGSFEIRTPEHRAFVAWRRKAMAHYEGMLNELSDADLLEMPLPVKVFWLQSLVKVCQARVKSPKNRPNAWDRLDAPLV